MKRRKQNEELVLSEADSRFFIKKVVEAEEKYLRRAGSLESKGRRPGKQK